MKQAYTLYENVQTLPAPENKNITEIFKTICRQGMKKRGLVGKPEYEARIEEEMDLIIRKDFGVYFIVLWDAFNFCKREGIAVGFGRGSSCGSLVNYVLEITEIDPIEHGLLFWRFLSEWRNGLPDVDSDISPKDRPKLKKYLEDKYGKDRVASVATFVYFSAKSAIKSACRVLNVPYAESNNIVKEINVMNDFRHKQYKEFHTKYPDVYKLASALDGRLSTSGYHAAATIISRMPITDLAPTESRKIEGEDFRQLTIALDKDEAEALGFVKYDFLVLKTLDVVSDCVDYIAKTRGRKIDIKQIKLEDPLVFKMISDGHTSGVFQCMKPEQPIHTKNGLKLAKDINFGDEVLTHKGRYRQVVNTMSRYSNNEMYKIDLARQSHSPIYLTGEHPILISDANFNMRWEKVQDIKALDFGAKIAPAKRWSSFAVFPKTQSSVEFSVLDQVVDSDLARFLGLYLAEGCSSKEGRICFTFHEKEVEYVNFVQKILKEKFDVKSYIQYSKISKSVSVRGTSKELAQTLNKIFRVGAKNKIIPHFIYSSSHDIIRSFLVGYAEGDGAIKENSHVAVQTASQNLAWGLKALVANIGSFTKVGNHQRTVGGNTHQVYTISFSLSTKKVTRKLLENEDFILIPIRNVIKDNYEGEVVNFEVEEDNSYCGEIVMHNCEASASTKVIKEMGIENFADLVASNALVRPGAWKAFGSEYIARKKGYKKVSYPTVDSEEFLKDTFGFYLFQEQSLLVCTEIAGLSKQKADEIRKITAHKQDKSILEPYKEEFIAGAIKNVSQKVAEKLWADIELTAEYSFNKCLAEDTMIEVRVDNDESDDYEYFNMDVSELFTAIKNYGMSVDFYVKGPEFINGTKVGPDAWHKIKDVHDNGVQDVFRIWTDSETHIDATANHKHRLSKRWKEVYRIHQNDQIWTNEGKVTVAGRKYVGQAQTYDLELESEPHAFYANGFLTHNSHSVAYSKLSFVCAYLKYYFPAEYMTALLNNEKDANSTADYLSECKRLDIDVRTPDVNNSDINYTVKDNVIYMGLSNVKYISDKLAERLINARPFKSYEDMKEKIMAKGSGLNSRVIDSLNKVGATNFPDHKVNIEQCKENFYEYLGITSFDTGQITSDMYQRITPLNEYEDKTDAVVIGIVQDIVVKGWIRVDFSDGSGGKGAVFVKPEHGLEKGKRYVFALAKGNLVGHIDLEKFSTINPLVRYLKGEMDQRTHFVAGKTRRTKNEVLMGDILFVHNGELRSATMFEDQIRSGARPGDEIQIALNAPNKYGTSVKAIRRVLKDE